MDDHLVTIIEWTAAVFGVVCVALTIRRSIWCWPTGLVQVLLYTVVFHHARLYSDLLLHVVFIGLQLYGWWAWLHGGQHHQPLAITRLASSAAIRWSLVAATATFALGFAMASWTDADLPYWDAATTVLSIIAQYLLARKILENWLIWIAVDLLCIAIYTSKGLYVTAGLYSVFLVLATMGLFVWLRTLKSEAKPVAAMAAAEA